MVKIIGGNNTKSLMNDDKGDFTIKCCQEIASFHTYELIENSYKKCTFILIIVCLGNCFKIQFLPIKITFQAHVTDKNRFK